MSQYLELKERHQAELNAFPMFFAFSEKQFAEGMAKLGLSENDTGKIYRLGTTGGFIRKSDSKDLSSLMKRHNKEMQDAIDADTTGKGFIFDMFLYELENHEYCITHDITDTLNALGVTKKQIENNPALKVGFLAAIEKATLGGR